MASNPFAPGRIIFDPNILACYLANFFGSASYFGILFFLPLYFQAVEGFSATMSGVLLVPAMIFSVVASLGGGWIVKKTGRFYWVTVGSYGVLFVSVFPLLLSVWHRFTPGETIGLAMTAIGGGSGKDPSSVALAARCYLPPATAGGIHRWACTSISLTDLDGAGMTTTLVGLLAHAHPRDSAMVVACSYLFRSLGSSIGISINSAVLQQVLRLQLSKRLNSGTEAREIEERVRRSLDCIKELPGQVAEQVRASYQMATLGALMPTLLFVTISFIVTFWVKEKVLKR